MEEKIILGKTLKNKITEYIYPIDELEDANFFALTVRAGSAAESKENAGVAHFLEHVQMSFFDEKEEGYFCSAYTDFYSTTFYFDAKSHAIDKVIDLIQGIIDGRLLEKFDIEKIRKDILTEYETLIMKNEQEDFRFLLEDTEYMTHLSIGTRPCICTLTKNDIKKFYETFYLMGNMSVTWIGPANDIKKVGTKWIEDLSGTHGEKEVQVLDYTFPEGKVNVLRAIKVKEMLYYFYRKKDPGEETINEILLEILEEILLQCCGNIRIDKLYLSCRQEFVRIVAYDGQSWKEIYDAINKITMSDIAHKYREFLKGKSIGCNCNSMREQFIDSFVYEVPVRQPSINIRKAIAVLGNVLKMSPVIIRKE